MNNKNIFLIGAGLGLAAGYLLNSDKGRELNAETADYLKDKAKNAEKKGSDIIQKATEMATNVKDKGNEYLQSLNEGTVDQKDVNNFIEKEIGALKSQLLKEVERKLHSVNGKVNA